MSLKNYLLFSLFLILSAKANAQSDTTYYDGNGYPCDWHVSEFFRVSERMPDGRFRVNDYFSNGKPKFSGEVASLDSMIYDGYCTHYFDDGKKESEGVYKRDKKEGVWKLYYNISGKVGIQYTYANGLLNGETLFYYAEGEIYNRVVYKKDILVSSQYFDKQGKKVDYTKKAKPLFLNEFGVPASTDTFSLIKEIHESTVGDIRKQEFQTNHIIYPEAAIEEGIQGRVIVRFMLDENGNVKNPVVIRKVHPSLDAEALRVIKSMPPWEPGNKSGRAVKVYFSLPIDFTLQ